MRLADFIVANMEPILADWEAFARSIWPAEGAPEVEELRNDAAKILHETARDMQSSQTDAEQAEKSKGRRVGRQGEGLDRVSSTHGAGRATSGFALRSVIAEYRALRASVLRLWRESRPAPDVRDLDDLTRFNESMDESLAEAVDTFAEETERARTALLAAEQASRREADYANQAKDLFLATLSHELRTPLNAIVGWLSLMERKSFDLNRLQEGLDVIRRSTNAQIQLIDDVLDVSRIVSGKLRLEIRPCELIDVIKGGLDAARPAAEAKNIALNLELDPAASPASADIARIQQVVWNLVSNAVKFTPKGGRVDVSLRRTDSAVELSVEDNGQGISAELLPHVFERFRQGDSSTRRSYAGLGLGLSIVKYIVEAHGGAVRAFSAGEGRGSTFTVTVPVVPVRIAEDRIDGQRASAARDGEPADDHRSPMRLDGLRVLVVDDEADARRVLVMALEHAGAAVTEASSAETALELLRKGRPDVLISDLGMPEQDGFDLIRQVRTLGHDETVLPAVALTAFVQADDVRRASQAGFQIHIRKPVDPFALASVIADLVGRA
jgi:signal transduction histidine kinase